MIATKTGISESVYAIANDPFIAEKETFNTSRRSWLAIWLFVCDTCEDLLHEDLVISEEQSVQMARRLEGFIIDGTFEKWQAKWSNASQDESCTVEDLKEFINFCGFSGGFTV